MSRKDGQLRRNQGGPGKTAKLANVTVGSISASLAIPDRKQAGVLQLLICVGWVYLSL